MVPAQQRARGWQWPHTHTTGRSHTHEGDNDEPQANGSEQCVRGRVTSAPDGWVGPYRGFGGGGGAEFSLRGVAEWGVPWHKASVLSCLPLAAPVGLLPLLILGGGGGGGLEPKSPKVCTPKTAKSTFPFVKFTFSHYEIRVRGGC